MALDLCNKHRAMKYCYLLLALALLLVIACGGADNDQFPPCDGEVSAGLLDELSKSEEKALVAQWVVDVPRQNAVVEKYSDLIQGYPYHRSTVAYFLQNSAGERIETYGIQVIVGKVVDPNVLPEHRRLPECLEGVPVQIVEVR